MADQIDQLQADVNALVAVNGQVLTFLQDLPAQQQAAIEAAVAGDMSRAQALDAQIQAQIAAMQGALPKPATPSTTPATK